MTHEPPPIRWSAAMHKRRSMFAAALLMGVLSAAVSSAGAAVSGFSGGYAPAAWTTTLTGTPGGGGAPVGALNDGSTLTLTGGDSGCAAGPCQLIYGITVPGPENVLSFHWNYASSDPDGPAFESFGYVVNGSYTQLTDPGGAFVQSGNQLLVLAPGAQFAWYVDCADCIFGNAVATITNLQAVPELPPLALLAPGALLLALRRPRRAP